MMPRFALFALGLSLYLHASLVALEPERLRNTETLTWTGDLSAKMLDGCHAFIDRKIAESIESRQQYWKRDFSSREAYEKSITENRRRFARQIATVDERAPAVMERCGNDDNPALVAETAGYMIYQVRWPVLGSSFDGVSGEGLLLEPKHKPQACIVAMADADQTPEQICGLAPGLEPEQQFARLLAEQGCLVVVPTLIDRGDRFTGNEISGRPNLGYSHREWSYRQAFHMGRHVIGYEVQKALAAVDWFKRRFPDAKVGVTGYGEGGLIAFYAAAVDPRIDATLVSGYFRSRQDVSEEPLERNVWALLHEFGDAEIASLIAPRTLVVEYSREPEIVSRQTTTPKEVNGFPLTGIHGRLSTPRAENVSAEFQRIDQLLMPGLQKRYLITGDAGQTIGPMSPQAVDTFLRSLDLKPQPQTAAARQAEQVLTDRRKAFDPTERQRRQVKQLEDHIQSLVNDSHVFRDQFFKVDASSVEKLVTSAKPFRQYAWEELFGKFEDPVTAIHPRSRQIYDRPQWTGYEVVLDVLPDVFAWGVLLLPKDLKPGERRPVVVCQHGRNGVPKDVIEGDHRAYHDYAAKLAERGFVVFAPHNPYRGEDRYRMLSRKANAVKGSLFSFILAQHTQILNWLETLPMVDSKRIAFYGLSYGGETAVRVPPLLERYCLSICSADFNDWTRKVASTHSPYSFMNTIEWEMSYFDMGRTFSYAELAALMAPRPFMVERGHLDGVAPDEWVASEYAKVRRLYDELGIGDHTAIEFFNGPHTINGQGTFDFLHEQLKWPKR
jgi:dienelactone hydrolase